MRNPDRIDEVIDALREVWKKNPDMRLTQLVYNAVAHGFNAIGVPPAFYNTEESTVLDGLEKMKRDA